VSTEAFSGVYPILAMPFDEGSRIDVEVLQREVEFMVEAGAHGVGIALASEVPTLNEAERDLALRVVVEQARGRLRVVMNTGAAGTDLALHYSRRAQDLGADAVMVLPPPPATTTAAETLGYYQHIAAGIRLPIFLQDVATSPIPPGLAARIADSVDQSWYLKVETPPTPPRVAEAVAGASTRLTVFGGAGGNFFLEELRRGARGTMPGSAIPEVFVQVWNLFNAGRVDDAQTIFGRYATLLNLLSQGSGIFFYLYKEVLRLRGVFTNREVRKPATEPDAIAYRELRHQVEDLGLGSSVTR
jgi:dihydrodipicolinate synthase/N-acetylneuraminate lyase